MNIGKLLSKLLKGTFLVCVLYLALALNETHIVCNLFFLLLSLSLTLLFLDDRKSKKALLLIIFILVFICAQRHDIKVLGFVILFTIIALYYVIFCKGNFYIFKQQALQMITKKEEANRKEKIKMNNDIIWSARKIFHPFEVYSFDRNSRNFYIKKGIFASLFGNLKLYSLNTLELGVRSRKNKLIMCDVEIQLNHQTQTKDISSITFSNLRKVRANELEEIFNGHF